MFRILIAKVFIESVANKSATKLSRTESSSFHFCCHRNRSSAAVGGYLLFRLNFFCCCSNDVNGRQNPESVRLRWRRKKSNLLVSPLPWNGWWISRSQTEKSPRIRSLRPNWMTINFNVRDNWNIYWNIRLAAVTIFHESWFIICEHCVFHFAVVVARMSDEKCSTMTWEALIDHSILDELEMKFAVNFSDGIHFRSPSAVSGSEAQSNKFPIFSFSALRENNNDKLGKHHWPALNDIIAEGQQFDWHGFALNPVIRLAIIRKVLRSRWVITKIIANCNCM